jgi:hypothetical protein
MSFPLLSRRDLSVGSGATAAAARTRPTLRRWIVQTSSICKRTDCPRQSEWRTEDCGSRGVRFHAGLARVDQVFASEPDSSVEDQT